MTPDSKKTHRASLLKYSSGTRPTSNDDDFEDNADDEDDDGYAGEVAARSVDTVASRQGITT